MDQPPKSTRRRKAAGPERQTYLDCADVDRVMHVLLALVSEVAAIRERLDTHERLGNDARFASVANVEAHVPDHATEGEREAWRDAFIRRLFRVITEDAEDANPVSGDVAREVR